MKKIICACLSFALLFSLLGYTLTLAVTEGAGESNVEGVSQEELAREYIALVQQILSLDTGEYAPLKAALDEEAALRERVDMDYPGVSEAYAALSSVYSKFKNCERHMNNFLEAANDALFASENKSYSLAKKVYDTAMNYTSNEYFVADHPYATEGLLLLATAKENLDEVLAYSSQFAAAVYRMSEKETVYDALMYVLPYYLKIDVTVSQTSELYRVFSEELRTYNTDAEEINSFFSAN